MLYELPPFFVVRSQWLSSHRHCLKSGTRSLFLKRFGACALMKIYAVFEVVFFRREDAPCGTGNYEIMPWLSIFV